MPKGKVSHTRRKDLPALPTASGVLSRLAAERAIQAGIDIEPLLKKSGVPLSLMEEPETRVNVRSQIDFLELAAEKIQDTLLGFHLARDCDLREIGPFYYVMASSERLGDAIDHAGRYSSIVNEGVNILRGAGALTVDFEYRGVERHHDRHQIEFWVTCTLRLARVLTNRELVPAYVGLLHQHDGDVSEMERYFGCGLDFGASRDRISLEPNEADLPIVTADPYLNRFIANYYEEAISRPEARQNPLRTKVENAIMPRLPHGTAIIGNIASELGMSARTLSRRLAEEGLTFSAILEQFRSNLSVQYLRNNELSISQIAWLLGYAEVSSFVHAFQRWTGRSPTYVRRQIASATGIGSDHSLSDE